MSTLPPPTSEPGRSGDEQYTSAAPQDHDGPAAQGPYGTGADRTTPAGHPGGAPAQPQNGMGLASLILGIVSFLTSWFPLLGLPTGVVGLILGILGMGKAKKGLATNRGMALAGTILSAIGLLAAVAWMAVSAWAYTAGYLQ